MIRFWPVPTFGAAISPAFARARRLSAFLFGIRPAGGLLSLTSPFADIGGPQKLLGWAATGPLNWPCLPFGRAALAVG
jgi:hypothetical protein